MDDILSATKNEAKYTIRVDYMPDQAAVQCVTIWNEGMNGEELADLVSTLENEYKPLKFVIVRVDP